MPEFELAVFIPTLNEKDHISHVLDFCLSSQCDIYVVDGGSADGTREIVKDYSSRMPARVFLLENPNKTQADAMQVFLSECKDKAYSYVIRMDAHSKYNAGFIENILDLLKSGKADSIVVPMETIGESGLQPAASVLFSSKLGTGGSAHRGGATSGYIDHGHHAGFTMESLQKLGGYDPYFVANEDAEYDYRLTLSGGKIFLSVENTIGYYPRKDYKGFYKQYVKYGFYRAANLLKHSAQPKLRQMLPVAAFVALILAVVSVFSGDLLFTIIGASPFMMYLVAVLMLTLRMPRSLSTKLKVFNIAVVTHLSFGYGFMMRCLGLRKPFGV